MNMTMDKVDSEIIKARMQLAYDNHMAHLKQRGRDESVVAEYVEASCIEECLEVLEMLIERVSTLQGIAPELEDAYAVITLACKELEQPEGA